MNKKILIILLVIVLLFAGLVMRRKKLKKEEIPEAETGMTDYLVRVKRACQPPEGSVLTDVVVKRRFIVLLTTPRFQFIGTKLNKQEKQSLEKDPCVSKISLGAEAKKNFEKLPPEIQEEVTEAMKKQFLAKSLLKKDVIDRKKLLEILKQEQPTLPKETISHYQLYITPSSPAVLQLASGKTGLQLYQEAVSWIWVDEETLNQTEEKWLKPEEFLSQTPGFATNPLPGRVVSDCSEQANTLVSLMRAGAVPAEQVRVVLGKVDFEGQVGGHSWVQIYKDGVWVDLDPTSGPHWDTEKQSLVQSSGFPWDYFKFFPFPVMETWVYYNDVYFYDFETREGNAPLSWR